MAETAISDDDGKSHKDCVDRLEITTKFTKKWDVCFKIHFRVVTINSRYLKYPGFDKQWNKKSINPQKLLYVWFCLKDINVSLHLTVSCHEHIHVWVYTQTHLYKIYISNNKNPRLQKTNIIDDVSPRLQNININKKMFARRCSPTVITIRLGVQ